MPHESLIGRLRRLDCCALSDALDRLRNAGRPVPERGGVVASLRQLSGTARAAGRVITVKLGPAPERAAQERAPARHLCAAAIEAGGPDDVIVIEQRTGIDAACWGGLLTLAARRRQIAGIVADGSIRDLEEARELAFPIHARGRTPLTARGRIAELATNVPVRIDCVSVAPGDYVLADATGIAFIAAEEIDAVLDTAEAIAAREAEMAAALRAGLPVTEVLSGAYERMLERRGSS